MDVPRKSAARNRRIRRAIYAAVALLVLTGAGVGIRRLKPAAFAVEGSTVWPGVVKRGPMLRQVRGLGTLVPEEIHWIPAVTEGRIERLLCKQSDHVKADSVLIEMSNPQLQQELLDAEFSVKVGEAAYTDLKVQLESKRLDQQASTAKVMADYHQAQMQADTNAQLLKEGLIAPLTEALSKVTAEELANRSKIEKQRLEINDESIKAQLDAQRARIDQLRGLYKLKRSQADSLKVRAGTAGVVQLISVEVGQRVSPGANLARVADPTKLKAELKIAETQTKDIEIGQSVTIDTRTGAEHGFISGRVMRIDAAAQSGTLTVDASLEGELPKGARPDLGVEGTIELERLEDVLYVERPVHGQENSLVSLFKYEPDLKGATRVPVKLGRSSVSYIEVVDGLKEGDQVILSDSSSYDNYDRIVIN